MPAEMTVQGAIRSRPGLKAVSLLMFFLAVNALVQAVRLALGWDTGPIALTLWQFACGLSALAAAAGTWLGERWSAGVIVAYGVITGALIVALYPMLALPQEARNGLIASGVGAVVVCALLAWYVARATGGVETHPDR